MEEITHMLIRGEWIPIERPGESNWRAVLSPWDFKDCDGIITESSMTPEEFRLLYQNDPAEWPVKDK